MNKQDTHDEDWADWAAVYAVGALSEEERARCERWLRSEPAFQLEVERLRPAVDALHLAAPALAPPAGLLERVKERALGRRPAVAAPTSTEAQPWKSWKRDAPGSGPFNFLPASDSEFEPTGVPGVEVRKLHVDERNDRITMLVRMDAGASYPPHRHAGTEECFVLSGDLSVGADLHMRAGDYQRVEQGSVHPVQSTREGCTLFIVSSMHDELLALGAH